MPIFAAICKLEMRKGQIPSAKSVSYGYLRSISRSCSEES